MVGIFKRCAKSGSLDDPNMKKCLENLAKSYTVLIASVDFLDVSACFTPTFTISSCLQNI